MSELGGVSEVYSASVLFWKNHIETATIYATRKMKFNECLRYIWHETVHVPARKYTGDGSFRIWVYKFILIELQLFFYQVQTFSDYQRMQLIIDITAD